MPPQQRTFLLVPNGPAGFAAAAAEASGPIRQMTSKQVKKARKEANRQPRVSRAEQRRIELAEQQRIRKELEQDRAAARARNAAQRRKEKKEAEIEARRRAGRPLVDVRPSQDTIVRFVRGNGTGKKRDGDGQEVQTAMETIPERKTPEVESPAKHACDHYDDPSGQVTPQFDPSQGMGEENPVVQDVAVETSHTSPQSSAEASQEDRPTAQYQAKSVDAVTAPLEPGESFTSEDLEGLAELVDAEMPTTNTETVPFKAPDTAIPQSPSSSPSLDDHTQIQSRRFEPPPCTFYEGPLEDDIWQDFGTLFETPGNKAIEMHHCNAPARPILGEEQRKRSPTHLQQRRFSLEEEACPAQEKATSSSERKSVEICQPSPQLRVDAEAQRRPAAQPEFNATYRGEAILCPALEKDHRAKPVLFALPRLSATRATMEPPPLSTQAILTNFDDFFPSPSQQAREIDDSDYTRRAIECRIPQPTPCPANGHQRPPCATQHDESPDQSPPHSAEKPRFFTSSGTNELLSVAITRSKRTAAREKRQGERLKRAATANSCPQARISPPRATASARRKSFSKLPPKPPSMEQKENEPPQMRHDDHHNGTLPIASQESEYGGGWIDDEDGLDFLL